MSEPFGAVLLTLEKSRKQFMLHSDFHRINKPLYTSISFLKEKLLYGLVLLIGVFLFDDLSAQDGEYTVYYYDNGRVSSEGYMLEGKPTGYWKTYFPSGQIKSEGIRQGFELDSVWTFYTEEGLPSTKITYLNGEKTGELLTYQAGVLFEKVRLEKGTRVGEAEIYYPTGELHKRIPYENGEEDGDGFEYARDGRVITLLKYSEGYLRNAQKINRYDSAGNKRGKWITFHPNGLIHVEGTYMNDKKNGIFKTFDKNGDLITLEKFRDGRLVVDTEESVILDLRNTYYPDGSVESTGGYVDGVREGTHRFYNRDGSIASAEIYDSGMKTAEGIVDEKGDLQGYWKLYYPSGELKAEGEYENSERTGDWIFYHLNGKIEHKGKYVEGEPQGGWTWYFDNGNLRREEYYRRGKEDGESVEYDREGNVITKGEYISGYKEGEWFYHVGDHTEKGNYRDGERTGEWIYEYPDGEMNFRGEYVAGLAVGKHQWFHPNGQLKKEGKFRSGIRTGTWKTYDENGLQELVVKYKNGKEYKINGRKVATPGDNDDEESTN